MDLWKQPDWPAFSWDERTPATYSEEELIEIIIHDEEREDNNNGYWG